MEERIKIRSSFLLFCFFEIRSDKKTVSFEKLKKSCQIPCNRRGFVLFYYGAVNYSLSFDARGCDTLGCIATQHRVGFLVELAYYLK